jgi:hypothetical protein
MKTQFLVDPLLHVLFAHLAVCRHFRGNARVMLAISTFLSTVWRFAPDLSSQPILLLPYPLEVQTLILAFSSASFLFPEFLRPPASLERPRWLPRGRDRVLLFRSSRQSIPIGNFHSLATTCLLFPRLTFCTSSKLVFFRQKSCVPGESGVGLPFRQRTPTNCYLRAISHLRTGPTSFSFLLRPSRLLFSKSYPLKP